MNLSIEQQKILLHDAAVMSNMDSHVQTEGYTAAEKIMQFFGGQKNTPRKMSYLYCDSVDACFYFTNNKACVTFTARWFSGAKDLEKLGEASKHIGLMLENMQSLADAVLKAASEVEM